MKVTVVIPCYNAAPFLRETLGSVLSQARRPEEVLVIDDGSTDDSAAIAESFGRPVRVIRQENRGESVARNRGIDLAVGEWVALLDADDRWEPGHLAGLAAAAQSAGEAAVCVFADFYYFRGDEPLKAVARPAYHADRLARARMLCHATVHPSASLVRTAEARAVRFPEETRHAEDMIFFAHLRERGDFVHVDAATCGYRISPEMQSRGRGFNLNSVRSRFEWFRGREDSYSDEERREVRRELSSQLVTAHDLAFWARDHGTVVRCREFFEELRPPGAAVPPSFKWRLFPPLLMRCKDSFDRLLGRVPAAVGEGSS